MPHINTNGINIHYELHGYGKPLVLIGGYTTNTLTWIPVLDILTQHFQVLLFDNRGAGDTEAPDTPYSIEMMADDAVALVDALNLEKPHIYGNSMGGAIAQMIAHRHSSKVDRIIIGNSSPCFNHQLRYITKYSLERYQLNQDQLEQAKITLPLIFSSSFLSITEQVNTFLELSANNPKPMSPTGMQRQHEALCGFNSLAWLAEIKNACLILSGDEDLFCLPKEARQMHQLIRGVQLHMFEHCGHLPHIEYPRESCRVVIKFLTQ